QGIADLAGGRRPTLVGAEQHVFLARGARGEADSVFELEAERYRSCRGDRAGGCAQPRCDPARRARAISRRWRRRARLGRRTGNRNVALTLKAVDSRESNLTRCTDDYWNMIHARLQASSSSIADDASSKDLWWLILVGVIGLLCSEVWMTRRMALTRGR